MTIEAERIDCAGLRHRVAQFKEQGCRLVTITCVRADDEGAELLYHFDHRLQLTHLRLTTSGDEVPSICGIYSVAFLAENEIQDQFGLHFAGLSPDYQRTLYLQGEGSDPPFRGKSETGEG